MIVKRESLFVKRKAVIRYSLFVKREMIVKRESLFVKREHLKDQVHHGPLRFSNSGYNRLRSI